MKRSIRWGSFTAIALSLLVAGQSAAATWAAPLKLSTGTAFADDLVMAGTTAVALYSDGEAEYLRRSTDGGVSWQPPMFVATLAPGGTYDHAIAAYENYVDLVFMREGRVRYRRSTDAGATFGSTTYLSPVSDSTSPVVAHGPGGLVVVAWGDAGYVRARVSTNNGVSFAAAKTIGAADIYLSDPFAAAIGDGVIYVAYYPHGSKLRLKRTTDAGVSWSSAFSVSNIADGDSGMDLVASGTHAYIAYANQDERFFSVDYRRTLNRGMTWSARMDLSPPNTDPAEMPQLFLRGGVLRAAYVSCVDNWDYCDPFTPWYTQSGDGINWSARQRILPTTYEDAFPMGVGSAGKPIVLLSAWRETDGWGAWARRRT